MKYPTGAWVDNRVPDLADLLPQIIPHDEFIVWLSERIGNYRSWRDLGAQFPSVATEKKELETFSKNLDAVIKCAEPGGLPPGSSGRLWHEANQRGLNWDSAMADFYKTAIRLQIVVNSVRGEMEPLKDRKGPKSRYQRDTLVEDVTQKLCSYGMGLNAARLLTRDILIRCRVPVSQASDQEDAIRSIRRAGDKIKQK